MSRTAQFVKNSLATAFMQVITILAGFIVPRIMFSVYGSEINGLISSITQFIAYFNLVEAGVSSAAIYSLYKPLATKNQPAINSIIVAAKEFYNLAGYIFVSLTLGLALVYPIFVSVDCLTAMEIGILVLTLGASGALEFFSLAKYRALLTADQKTYVISIVSTLAIILNTAIIATMAWFDMNIVLVRAVGLLSVFLRSFLLHFYVKKKYAYVDYTVYPNTKALNKRWDALYLQILGSLHSGAAIVLATIFTDLKTVSVYAVYNLVLSGLNGILGIFSSGVSASFGDVIARKERDILQKAYSEFELSYYMLITGVYAIAFVMIMPFIRLYTKGVTDTNYDLPMIGFLMVLNGLLFSIKNPQGMLVISAGLYRETRLQTSLQGAIVIILGIFLGKFYGLYGILIAALLSNLYRDIDLIIFIPRYVTKLNPMKTVGRIVCIFVMTVIICLPTIFFDYTISDWIDWVLYLLLYIIYAAVIIWGLTYTFERKVLTDIMRRFTGLRR